jgi:uncharacterized iron-regulated membrane protein
LKKRTKITFSLHHWCGLIAGIFLLTVTLSGAVLVFHDEIDHTQFAKELKLQTPARVLHIDRSFETIRQANPDWDIRIPALPEANDQALKYELRQDKLRKWIFAHPETGEILSVVDRADLRLVNTMLLLHYSLFAGTAGKMVVLISGVAFLVLTVTGFLLYRKSILKVLSFKQKVSLKSSKSFFSSMHRVVGVWALLFNLLISITGTWFAYVVVDSALNSKNKGIETPPVGVPVESMLNNVKSAHPDFEIMYLKFPSSKDGKLLLLGHLKNDPILYGHRYSSMQLDIHTGEIVKTDLLSQMPWSARVPKILQTLHIGEYAGMWLKVLYCIGGLMPGLLSVSGFVIWFYRRKASGKKKVTDSAKRRVASV